MSLTLRVVLGDEVSTSYVEYTTIGQDCVRDKRQSL